MTVSQKLWSAVCLMVCFCNFTNAQVAEHHHDHHTNELALAASPVFIFGEKNLALGLHAHVIHHIPHSKFGFGLGYEKIFDEHKHNSLGVIGSYRPIGHLNFSISPSINFEGTDRHSIKFAMHFETSYEFEFEDFHIGPVMEFAASSDHYHLSLGIHIGYGF